MKFILTLLLRESPGSAKLLLQLVLLLRQGLQQLRLLLEALGVLLIRQLHLLDLFLKTSLRFLVSCHLRLVAEYLRAQMPLAFEVLFALLGDLRAELLPELRHLFPHLLDDVNRRLLLLIVDLGLIEHVQVVDSLLQFLYLTLPVEGEDLLPAEFLLHHQALLIPSDYLELLLLDAVVQGLYSLLVADLEDALARFDVN